MKLTTHILVLVFGLVLGLLIGCKSCGNKAGYTSTTKTTSDTTVTPVSDSTPPHTPKPVQVTPPSMAKDEAVIKWLSPEVIVKPDTVNYVRKELYQQLYEAYVNVYSVCAPRKDYDSTYKFEKGSVRMTGYVQGNALQDFRLFPTFPLTTITNTVTTTVQAKPRNSVWLGVDGMYSDSTVGLGASLMFQSKRGWGIEAAAAINQQGAPVYRAGFRKRISFR